MIIDIPIAIAIETVDVGATQEVTFKLNGVPFYSYCPGTRHEYYALELANKRLGLALARLISNTPEE